MFGNIVKFAYRHKSLMKIIIAVVCLIIICWLIFGNSGAVKNKVKGSFCGVFSISDGNLSTNTIGGKLARCIPILNSGGEEFVLDENNFENREYVYSVFCDKLDIINILCNPFACLTSDYNDVETPISLLLFGDIGRLETYLRRPMETFDFHNMLLEALGIEKSELIEMIEGNIEQLKEILRCDNRIAEVSFIGQLGREINICDEIDEEAIDVQRKIIKDGYSLNITFELGKSYENNIANVIVKMKDTFTNVLNNAKSRVFPKYALEQSEKLLNRIKKKHEFFERNAGWEFIVMYQKFSDFEQKMKKNVSDSLLKRTYARNAVGKSIAHIIDERYLLYSINVIIKYKKAEKTRNKEEYLVDIEQTLCNFDFRLKKFLEEKFGKDIMICYISIVSDKIFFGTLSEKSLRETIKKILYPTSSQIRKQTNTLIKEYLNSLDINNIMKNITPCVETVKNKYYSELNIIKNEHEKTNSELKTQFDGEIEELSKCLIFENDESERIEKFTTIYSGKIKTYGVKIEEIRSVLSFLKSIENILCFSPEIIFDYVKMEFTCLLSYEGEPPVSDDLENFREDINDTLLGFINTLSTLAKTTLNDVKMLEVIELTSENIEGSIEGFSTLNEENKKKARQNKKIELGKSNIKGIGEYIKTLCGKLDGEWNNKIVDKLVGKINEVITKELSAYQIKNVGDIHDIIDNFDREMCSSLDNIVNDYRNLFFKLANSIDFTEKNNEIEELLEEVKDLKVPAELLEVKNELAEYTDKSIDYFNDAKVEALMRKIRAFRNARVPHVVDDDDLKGAKRKVGISSLGHSVSNQDPPAGFSPIDFEEQEIFELCESCNKNPEGGDNVVDVINIIKDIIISGKTKNEGSVYDRRKFMIAACNHFCRQWFDKPNKINCCLYSYYINRNVINIIKNNVIDGGVADIYPAQKLALFLSYLCFYVGVIGIEIDLDEFKKMIASYVIYVFLFNTWCACIMERRWNSSLSNEYVYKKEIVNGHDKIMDFDEATADVNLGVSFFDDPEVGEKIISRVARRENGPQIISKGIRVGRNITPDEQQKQEVAIPDSVLMEVSSDSKPEPLKISFNKMSKRTHTMKTYEIFVSPVFEMNPCDRNSLLTTLTCTLTAPAKFNYYYEFGCFELPVGTVIKIIK